MNEPQQPALLFVIADLLAEAIETRTQTEKEAPALLPSSLAWAMGRLWARTKRGPLVKEHARCLVGWKTKGAEVDWLADICVRAANLAEKTP